jgi:hypothetical protein
MINRARRWLSCRPCYKKVVLLATELTIWGRCLFSFRLPLCYCPPSCSKLGAILKSSNVVWNSVLTTKLWLTGCSSATRQRQASFWVVHYSFFLWWGGHGKYVEVDESCFSRWKCNCSKLCATPALHLLLIAPPTHCSPSLRCVSYLAPQMSVVCWAYNVRLCNEGLAHQAVEWSVSFVAHRCSHTWSKPRGSTSSFTSGLTEKIKFHVW